MAVRSSSFMPFSIQAILNRKGEEEEEDDEEEEEEEEEEKDEGGRCRLKELDMCFSKSACWKIFGGTHEDEDEDDAREDRDRGQREREKERASHHKSYDSDSGLSEDHHHDHHHLDDEREAKSSSGREQRDGCDSRALDESFQDETDRESTAAEQARELSDCELLASVSGKCLPQEATLFFTGAARD